MKSSFSAILRICFRFAIFAIDKFFANISLSYRKYCFDITVRPLYWWIVQWQLNESKVQLPVHLHIVFTPVVNFLDYKRFDGWNSV